MTLRLIRSASLGTLAMPAILRSGLMFTGPQANILTGLLPDLMAGLEVVSRELVGIIPIVTRSATMERAALHQPVTYPKGPIVRTHDNTPAMTVPEPEDHEFGVGSVTITKSKNANFGMVGEEQRAINTGIGDMSLQAMFFAGALRTLVNEVEQDLFSAAYVAASRAWGTAGTTPLLTGSTETANLRRILNENGAPAAPRALVIDSMAAAGYLSNPLFNKVNESGTELTLRQGEIANVHGFSIHETGANASHTKGTGTLYTTNTAGYAVGATEITLITGTGTVKAGDVVTFAGDDNKYVVAEGVAAPGTISLGAPGLREAIPASATAMTIGGSYTAGVAMSSDAMVLAARAPAMPKEGDQAVDSYLLTDPRSGITFDVRVYLGFGKVRYQVGLAWGWGVPNPEHMALLLG